MQAGERSPKGFLRKFSVYNLVIIAMMASLGIAVKPIVVSLSHLITGPLLIPGGALAGGFYMMWLILGAGLIGRTGTATLIGLIQAIMVIASGIFGSHGIFSLVTYTMPGVAVDSLLFLSKLEPGDKMAMFLGGIAANVTGVVLSNVIFFRLPLIPFVLSLSIGALSGGLGGILAFMVAKRLERLKL